MTHVLIREVYEKEDQSEPMDDSNYEQLAQVWSSILDTPVDASTVIRLLMISDLMYNDTQQDIYVKACDLLALADG